jgi:hypothetical protein
MSQVQDPRKQIGYLQQCLSSDKKPLGLFLGAGCPTAVKSGGQPLIPDIAGITAVVRAELAKCKECGPLLATVEEHFKKDCRPDATLEDMLSHVRALRAVAGNDQVRGLSAGNLDKFDERICELIHGLVNKVLPDASTPYHSVAAWSEAIGRDKPVEVFTTNYDLLIEQAFEDCQVPYFDGFVGACRPCFDLRAMEEDVLPPRWARLWKLHGSINWHHTGAKGVFRGAASGEKGTRRVIHPSHMKYQESRRLPYLGMMDRLRGFLKLPTATLVLCGYSFRDEHVNEVIVQGLQSTPTAIAFALMYDEIGKHPDAAKLGRGRSNLTVLARDGGCVGGHETKWPERDASTPAASSNKWLEWVPLDPRDANGRHATRFTLGDFAIFGQFLRELVGTVRLPTEVASVP